MVRVGGLYLKPLIRSRKRKTCGALPFGVVSLLAERQERLVVCHRLLQVMHALKLFMRLRQDASRNFMGQGESTPCKISLTAPPLENRIV